MLMLISLLISFIALVDAQSCIGNGILNKNFNKCYYYFDTELAYREAEFVCTGLAKEGRLVAIHSETEQAAIYGDARHRFALNDYWIGLNDINEPQKWEWTDDVTSSYVAWNTGYPTTDTKGTDCVASRRNSGLWYNIDCDAKRYFVCEASPNEFSAEVEGNVCGGRGMYSPYSQRCLYFMNSMQTYLEAERTCVSIEGLLINYDIKEKEKFGEGEVRENMRSDIWIGLSAPYGDGVWEWSNSANYLYTHWLDGYPSSVADANCVAALENCSRWVNDVCDSTKRTFVCETEALPGSIARYGSDWTYYPMTQALYYALPNMSITETPYDEMEDRCVTFGAHLASLHSSEELALVFGLAYTVSQNVAIGCRTTNGLSTCQWTDNTPYDFNGWHSNPSSGSNCANLTDLTGWYPAQCGSTAHIAGVCKKPYHI